jgi:hypothetical protein
MSFTHPLARAAHVASTAGMKGKVRHILVIITGLQLDKEHKKYKEESIKRLSDAARDWLEDHSNEAGDFMLMNRPKKWAGDKD